MHKRHDESDTDYLIRIIQTEKLEKILHTISSFSVDLSATGEEHKVGVTYGFNQMKEKVLSELNSSIEEMS